MISLDIVAPDRKSVIIHELIPDGGGADLKYQIRIQLVPGARAIELVLREDGKPAFRAELLVEDQTPYRATWKKNADGGWRLNAEGAQFRVLAPDYEHERSLLWRQPEDAPVDLLFLIDGTMRTASESVPASGAQEKSANTIQRLLSTRTGLWGRIAKQLAGFAGLFEPLRLHCGVCAFGDHAVSHIHSAALVPDYVVYPQLREERKFESFNPERLQAVLTSIPPTSGADWVDALADGLDACAGFPWRTGSRRIVVLLGESPGYNVLDPPPLAGNAQPRFLDVEQQARKLHRQGIEIASIHFDAAPGAGVIADSYFHENANEYLNYSRRQYSALATLPQYAQVYSQFDPQVLFDAIARREVVLARGIQPGLIVEE